MTFHERRLPHLLSDSGGSHALLALSGTARAGSVTLAWDAVPGAAGYVVVYGVTSGTYTYALGVDNQTTATVRGLAGGVTYYFAVEAYSALGDVSLPSNEIVGSTTDSAPTLADPGAQSSNEGSPVSLQLIASDVDGDVLTYRADRLPDGLSLNPATGLPLQGRRPISLPVSIR